MSMGTVAKHQCTVPFGNGCYLYDLESMPDTGVPEPQHSHPIDGKYGPAITQCDENDKGELWVTNGEYASRVDFCPYCGMGARSQMKAVTP